MLVLSREPLQRVMVGNDVVVWPEFEPNGRVTLKASAPDQMHIYNLDGELVIDENISVRVLTVRGLFIRLGFEAPKEVSIWREEIFWKLKKEKAA